MNPSDLLGRPAVDFLGKTYPSPAQEGATVTVTPPLRYREGDQPPPTPNQLPHIHELVIEDVRGRMALGTKRYGTPLQPRNGRSALRDAYEEALDLCAYLRQKLWEEENPVAAPRDVQGNVIEGP